MNRRSFLGGLAALIGGIAIEEAIPLGRVWSFPSKIIPVNAVIASYADYISISDLAITYYDRRMLDILTAKLKFEEALEMRELPSSGGRIRLYT